jgi:hypothetical protein
MMAPVGNRVLLERQHCKNEQAKQPISLIACDESDLSDIINGLKGLRYLLRLVGSMERDALRSNQSLFRVPDVAAPASRSNTILPIRDLRFQSCSRRCSSFL